MSILIGSPAAIQQRISLNVQQWATIAGPSIYTILRDGGGVTPFGVLASMAVTVLGSHTTASDATSTTINTTTSAIVTETCSWAISRYQAISSGTPDALASVATLINEKFLPLLVAALGAS